MKSFTMSRRNFMKFCFGSAAVLGISTLARAEPVAKGTPTPLPDAMDLPDTKPGVVWIEAQDCAGCTESILSSLTPDIREFVLDDVAIRYHETIMAGAGIQAEQALYGAIDQGGYVLVIEGSIPETDTRYLEVGGIPVEETFIQAATQAAVILAVGACATYGGIPKAGITRGEGVRHFLDKHGIMTPLINLPGCPVHPVWFYDTVYAFLNNAHIDLDQYSRPVNHFCRTIHDNCKRKQHYDANRFILDWNDPAQKQFCLLKKGCRGPRTHADCPVIEWNEGANWCIENNAPCAGCTEPFFYHEDSGLYRPQEK